MRIRQILALPTYRGKTPKVTANLHRRILELHFEAMVRTNMVWLMLHPKAPLLYRSGVRFRRERDGEIWRDAPTILRHGGDDCEGLSAYLAAECRVRAPNSLGPERRPLAVVTLRKTRTPGLWHAVVKDRANGKVFDPSRKLGMRGEG